ncbi:reverse transcriptase [Gossypium australe]|uniref:Reverse transcriptase n=1 Tax=Gossypium australe TaxID=47621 RepID=A0A5B6VT87_9ROSI|nr:reverse transcriptase [Gossypium australe]
MSAISSSSMQILWNSVPTQKFRSARGIRQGCPLSPYLFVLCMDWLGHLIRSDIDSGGWKPIQISRTGPVISHLFFANDLEVQNLGKYLDVPLLRNRVTKSTFGFVVDKFILIPKGVCDDIEKLAIGDKASVRCWKDSWVPVMGPLLSNIPSASNLDLYFSVRELVNSDGSWNLELLRIWVLEEVINRIISIPPPHLDSGSDKVIWACSTTERMRRGIGLSNSCAICGHELEDMVHVLRDYPVAKDVWKLVLPNQLEQRFFFSDSFQTWISSNLSCHVRLQDSKVTWSCLFGLIAWRIWKNRNLFIFQKISWMTTGVVKISTSWARVCSPIEAEVWSIQDGILLLLNKGFRRIIVQTDSLEAVQTLSDLDLEESGITVLRRIQRIMKSEGQWRILHVPREQNLVADRLAKLSLNWKSTL